ncbi:hypothetical protein CONCODRAFT_13194 [Conidiobolus coronatus NRRL 28638]|uniref:Uncharacterized protein n=1 Tax=Conidiobolus coronatus (strain ATCC 28846 / CBS 209.66 / NRRL 28638) TaxID=796925 RepID=A0A137NRC9_CONC2|nr:hypothetical protein CONCODRAFT_13194 [Conidiobolus coronatus NRRL 28638]|eukprot:KXN65274.1 hypothetical protein CONCODRAFT_13194 [Conidiobolus coronatus NRRL 28638]
MLLVVIFGLILLVGVILALFKAELIVLKLLALKELNDALSNSYFKELNTINTPLDKATPKVLISRI